MLFLSASHFPQFVPIPVNNPQREYPMWWWRERENIQSRLALLDTMPGFSQDLHYIFLIDSLGKNFANFERLRGYAFNTACSSSRIKKCVGPSRKTIPTAWHTPVWGKGFWITYWTYNARYNFGKSKLCWGLRLARRLTCELFFLLWFQKFQMNLLHLLMSLLMHKTSQEYQRVTFHPFNKSCDAGRYNCMSMWALL